MPANEGSEDPVVRREEEKAAAEAGAIGGPVPDADLDPSERPVSEGGGGQAEGFELAEQALVDQAQNREDSQDPTTQAGRPEPGSADSTASYGEPDEVDPTEVVADPDGGDEDPGAGPGIAADR